MHISAHSVFHPELRINDAAIVAAAWPEDTCGYYAVALSEAEHLVATYASFGATAFIVSADDASRLATCGAWIGIKEASVGGCGAWGRAVVVVQS